MPVIADLSVILTATTGRFTAAFRDAGASVTNLAKRATIADKILNGVMALGVIATGKELFSFAVNTIMAADANIKLADRLGVTAGELSKLHFAAKLAGESGEMLDTALTKMEVNLGKGTPETVAALQRVGLNIDKLKNMEPTEALRKIADGMARLTTASDKAAFAVEIFGKGGAGMVEVLKGGSTALDIAAQKSHDLGKSLSEIQSKNIEEAADAMKELDRATSKAHTNAAALVAPLVTMFAIVASGKVMNFAKGPEDIEGLDLDLLKGRKNSIDTLSGRTSLRLGDDDTTKELTGANRFGYNSTDKLLDFFQRDEGMFGRQNQNIQANRLADKQGLHELSLNDLTAAIEDKDRRDALLGNQLSELIPGRSDLDVFGDHYRGGPAKMPEMDLHAVSRGTFSGEFASGIGIQGTAQERSAKALEELNERSKTGGLLVQTELN